MRKTDQDHGIICKMEQYLALYMGEPPGIGDLGIWQPLNGWSSGRGILGAAKSPKLVDTSKAMKILNKSMGDLQDPKTEVR